MSLFGKIFTTNMWKIIRCVVFISGTQIDSILLTSSIASHHYVKRGGTYVFTLLSPVCSCTPYCTKDGTQLTELTHVNNSFRLYFGNLISSGLYACSLVDDFDVQRYVFTLTVYVAPVAVKLHTNTADDFDQSTVYSVVSQTTNVKCYSYGMLPSGQLQIFLGQEMISKQTFNNTNLKESALFDVFTSVNIVPNWKHDGLSLSCIVNQPQISDIEVESRHIELEIIIEFYHNARLDRGYNASEGDDVILNCSSNYPYAATYTWKHVESGKTINGRILNYTDIHCDAAGDYTCTVDPEKDRSSANVTTCISMTCLIPQEPLYVRIVRRYKGRIIIEWSPPIHWQYTQYIVEWKGKSGELIEHHPLPILDNDPPFNFTIEDENIESIYWIGVYGKTGKTKSNYNAISVIKESTSATPGATPNCNNMYYDDDAFNIPISIIAVSSVTLFVAGCLTSMCLSKTMRRIRRKARAKSATAVSHSSTYMHYLPNEEEDTTYQDLCDVDNNEMSSYENIDNSVYKTQSIIKSCTTVAENIEPVYESTT